MTPTIIGFVVMLVGFVLLLRGRLEAMLCFAMLCTLMSGSAAIVLTALGGSSIAPASVGMGFLILRIALDGSASRGAVGEAVRVNGAYVVYAAWALAGAMILPRIFAHQIDVVPLRPLGLRNLYDVFPLTFTSQNITAPVYIAGSCLLAIGTYVAVGKPRGAVYFVKAAIAVAAVHLATGLADLLLPEPLWSAIKGFFRNGSYAQLDQSISGFKRIAGILPEASGYAAYGFSWFVFMAELWLRDVLPKRTGAASLTLLLVLIVSTSSTAYVSLGAYGLLLGFRAAVFLGGFRVPKVLWIGGVGLASIVATCSVALLSPFVADQMWLILQHMTVDKAGSASGMQRAFWAKQGLDAFTLSYGLGIGAGSFRSSNIFTAILGSLGAIGVAAWLVYLAKVLHPFHRSTYLPPASKVAAIGVAASWAAACVMIPAMVGAPSPDLGDSFSIFAGAALCLRRRSAQSVAERSKPRCGMDRRADSPLSAHFVGADRRGGQEDAIGRAAARHRDAATRRFKMDAISRGRFRSD